MVDTLISPCKVSRINPDNTPQYSGKSDFNFTGWMLVMLSLFSAYISVTDKPKNSENN